MKRFTGAAVLALAGLPALAADPATPANAAPAPASASVRAADVATVDGIIAALYDVISGPAGQARDWQRMHSLFMPDARMMVVAKQKDGSIKAIPMSVDGYIARSGQMLVKNGFFETELGRTTERFGELVHVFSTYEARHASTDAAPFARGINSIQLYHDGQRWWVVSLVWQAEDAQLKLPERYLHRR